MTDTWTLAVDTTRVSHETIDGEVLVIDSETGTYVSLTGSAVVLWELLLAGTSRAQAVDVLTTVFDTDATTAGEAVDDAVGALVEAAIVRPIDAIGPPPAAPDELLPFLPAGVEVYTDMQDLLLFDPIHEVDTSGWPNAAP